MVLSKKNKFVFLKLFRLSITILVSLVSSCCRNINIPQLDHPILLAFDQFTNRLNTGDIILFHGDSDFGGGFGQVFEN